MANRPLSRLLGRLRGGQPAQDTPPPPAAVEPTIGATSSKKSERRFAAAEEGRLTASWGRRAGGGDANVQIYADHASLVRKSREQSINSPYAKRFYQLLKQNVIGPSGIAYQSRAETGLGDEADRKRRRQYEEDWREWGEFGNCDVTRQHSMGSFLRLWVETLARDGEVMVREVRGFPHNKWRYALQIIECDRLDPNLNSEHEGRRIRMGVELDEWEAPVAYWLLADHPGDVQRRSSSEQRYFRVPASELIHTFDPWRPHQHRGFPWSHASMLELHHLDEYRKSEIIAAEIGAKKLGFYEQNPDAFDGPPKKGEDPGELHEDLEPGTYQVLPYGVTFKAAPTDHPATNFAPFIKGALRGAAAGMGPSYNRLAHDLEGVSFSSMRSAELDERDMYKLAQKLVIERLLHRIGRSRLEMAMIAGLVPGRMSSFEKLAKAAWRPRGWSWVDPTKDSKAATESLNNRTKSHSKLIRDNGDDPEEVFEEIAADQRRMSELGIERTEEVSNDKADNGPAGGDNDDDEDDDDNGRK